MPSPIPLDSLPEQSRRALGGPPQLRAMLARGMAPLPPLALVSALAVLTGDDDPGLSSVAAASLGKLPRAVLGTAIAAPELHGMVADVLLERFTHEDEIVSTLLPLPTLSPAAVARIAKNASENICELIAVNEQRLLANPAIIEALYLNPKCRMSTADRLIEMAGRHGLELSIPSYRGLVSALHDELLPEAGERTPADDMFFEALEDRTAVVAAADAEEGVVDDLFEEDDDGNETVAAKYSKTEKRLEDMSISEKVRVAILGNASHRAILVRSPNRVVAMAAISSPKLQERDAVSYASSRQVSDEVLRYIAGRRDFVRHYQAKFNLVFNPKTPVDISMRLLQFLRESDVKLVLGNKNVPSGLKTAAGQLMAKRNKTK